MSEFRDGVLVPDYLMKSNSQHFHKGMAMCCRNWSGIDRSVLRLATAVVAMYCALGYVPAARAQFSNPFSKAKERAEQELRRRREQAARAAQRAAEAARRAEARARQAAGRAGGRFSHWSKEEGGRVSAWGHDRGRVISHWGQKTGGRIAGWGHRVGGHASRGAKKLGGRAWDAWRSHPGNVEVGRVWYRIFKKKWDRSVRSSVDRANNGLDDAASFSPIVVDGASMEFREAPGGRFSNQIGDDHEPNGLVDVDAPHGAVIAHALTKPAHDGSTSIYNGHAVRIAGVFHVSQGRARLALFDSQGTVIAAGNWVSPGGGPYNLGWVNESFDATIPKFGGPYMFGVQLDAGSQATIAGVALIRR